MEVINLQNLDKKVLEEILFKVLTSYLFKVKDYVKVELCKDYSYITNEKKDCFTLTVLSRYMTLVELINAIETILSYRNTFKYCILS